MSDSCGIYQHSTFGIPDRLHGYCIDDVARALIFTQWARESKTQDSDLTELETVYAAFINHAWNPDTQRFRNFMSFERTWKESTGSPDSNGRAFWAIGETVRASAGTHLGRWAENMARQTGPSILT